MRTPHDVTMRPPSAPRRACSNGSHGVPLRRHAFNHPSRGGIHHHRARGRRAYWTGEAPDLFGVVLRLSWSCRRMCVSGVATVSRARARREFLDSTRRGTRIAVGMDRLLCVRAADVNA